MKRLKRGDTVQVISGTDTTKRGKVLRVDEQAGRVVVQGVNLVYKHIKRSQKYPQGGRIQVEAPVHVSNVMLYSDEEGRPVRVRMGRDDKGRKVRVSTRTGRPVG